MKNIKILLAASLLGGAMFSLSGLEGSKTVYKVLKGDSSTVYQKPGLSVNLKYSTEQVDAGELSQVKMELSTALSSGTLKLHLKSLDGELEGLEQNEYSFELSEASKSFPIELEVSSSVEGIHYLSLTLFVDGKGGRSFAIPVNVGRVMPKMAQKATLKTREGERLSISKAIETVK